MAAVKWRAEGGLGPGTAAGAEDEDGPLSSTQGYGQGEVDIQKQRQEFVFRSFPGSGGVWPANVPIQQPDTHMFPKSSTVEPPYSYRSPESVEMDEIMAAMVLTSLSCSPAVQSPPQRDALTGGGAEPECGGGELSDSGSSGYWSWDYGSVSPAPSPSVTETESSAGQPGEEGLQMELEGGASERAESSRCKVLCRAAYRCLWPGCGKVLSSRVGMKRHIRILHLGSVSGESDREEDFYYSEVSSEEEELTPPSPAPSLSSTPWSSCSSAHSQPPPETPPTASTALSQSAPGSVWQIHSEHLYQACAPVELSVCAAAAASCSWTQPCGIQPAPQMVAPRSRSVSVGEQWLQRNSASSRTHTISASPSRGHCSFRKGRGEGKKCRKVYGVERREQWCTACRWKKACQRFPD